MEKWNINWRRGLCRENFGESKIRTHLDPDDSCRLQAGVEMFKFLLSSETLLFFEVLQCPMAIQNPSILQL